MHQCALLQKKLLHLMGERVRIAIRWLRRYAVWGKTEILPEMIE